MAEANGNGRVKLSTNDIIKYGTILLILGGSVARYELRQNTLDERLAAIEKVIASRDDLMHRTVAALERIEADNHLHPELDGVSSGASSRRGR